MSKSLCLASLLLITACADLGPTHTVTPSTEPLFELVHGKEAGDDVTWKTRVFASGEWTYEDSTGAHRSGRLAAGDLATMSALRHAAWTALPPPPNSIRCMGLGPDFFDYFVDGKQVWHERQCDQPNHLDVASRAKLDAAIHVAESVTNSPKIR